MKQGGTSGAARSVQPTRHRRRGGWLCLQHRRVHVCILTTHSLLTSAQLMRDQTLKGCLQEGPQSSLVCCLLLVPFFAGNTAATCTCTTGCFARGMHGRIVEVLQRTDFGFTTACGIRHFGVSRLQVGCSCSVWSGQLMGAPARV